MSNSIRLTPTQLRIDGKQVLKGLTKLGQGAFTYCYDAVPNSHLLSNCVVLNRRAQNGFPVVLLASCDPLKELYGLGWFDSLGEEAFGSQVVFPVIEKIDCFDDSNYCMYIGAKYRKFSKKSASHSAWMAYRALKHLMSGYSCRELSEKFSKENPNRYAKGLCEWIVSVCDTSRNYGDDIRVEISPINVALDDYGNLVLLDIFFSPKTLRSTIG